MVQHTERQRSRIRIATAKGEILAAIGGYLDREPDLTHEELAMALSQVLDRQIQHLWHGEPED